MTSRKRAVEDNDERAKRPRPSLPDDNDFLSVAASLTLSLPPIFSSNPHAGVREMLDSMLMRYIPALQGVVLSHSNSTFLESAAIVQGDCPFLTCKVAFDAIVWCPRMGSKLSGIINLCSPDHISLLVHRTFNVSIPRSHIPNETWIFEYGPAANDPEYAEPSGGQANGGDAQRSRAHWVHHLTNTKLGGEDGSLEFTVIGLTVANEMLSLLGSLQPDPFSPRHNIAPSGTDKGSATSDEDEEDGDGGSSSSESEGFGVRRKGKQAERKRDK